MSGFLTVKVPNLHLALYVLSIRAPEPPYLAIDTFIFPLSPQRIRKVMTAMSTVYDTSGPPIAAGVSRSVDSYGMSPFVYEIEGTTGWDRHLTDGFILTGQQAIQRLQQMLLRYAELNQIQRLNNNPNGYILEFGDFFNKEFYQVEPIGPIEINASDRAPLLQYFRMRLAGIQPIAAPITATALDLMAIALAGTPAAVSRTTLAFTALLLASY